MIKFEIETGHSMQNFTDQPIPRFCKIAHIHYCAEALKAKDIRNFIRHFLWLTADFRNIVENQKSLRSVIAELTGWDPKAITNAITRLAKDGELARINDRSFVLNHKLANKFPSFGSFHKYDGLQPRYSDGQEKLIKELRKLVSLSAPTREDIDAEAYIKEYEAEMLAEIHRISEEMTQLKDMVSNILQELKKHDPQKAEHFHLKVINGGIPSSNSAKEAVVQCHK